MKKEGRGQGGCSVEPVGASEKKEKGKEEAFTNLCFKRELAKRRDRERRRHSLYCDLNGVSEEKGKGEEEVFTVL